MSGQEGGAERRPLPAKLELRLSPIDWAGWPLCEDQALGSEASPFSLCWLALGELEKASPELLAGMQNLGGEMLLGWN